MASNKHAHLEMIQGVVNRLSQNSFLLKGWTVILVSAIFTLAAKNSDFFFVYLAYFPAIAFWYLDGYFLWQERLFRRLYNHVRRLPDDQIDFSMNVSNVPGKTDGWVAVTLSKTLIAFHGVVVALVSIAVVMSIDF